MEKTPFCEFVDGIPQMPANTPLCDVKARTDFLYAKSINMPSPYDAANIVGTSRVRQRWAVIAIKLLGEDRVPVIERLDTAILARIHEQPHTFDMGTWHGGLFTVNEEYGYGCGTTHCRAGWAVHLSKKAGYDMEQTFGPALAGAVIYMHNTGRVPDFGSGDDVAIADMKRSAAEGN